MDDIIAEFGRKSDNVCLDDYYRGHGLVPNTLRNKNIPIYRNPLSLDMFYGTSNYNGSINISIHNATQSNEEDVSKGSITILGFGSSCIWKFCIQPANHFIVAIPKQNLVTWNTGALPVGWHLVGVWDETDWHYHACYIADGFGSSYILGKEHSSTGWFDKASITELLIKT